MRLVPVDVERHLENALRWVNDPVVTEWLLIGDHPTTRAMEREFFEARSESEILFAIETIEGRHIGMSGIHGVSYRHGFAHTGSFLGDPELWGQGLGTEASKLRARYAFEVLGLRQLESSHLGGNERSAGMLLRTGYQPVGVSPERYWKRGAYRDDHRYLLRRERWRELNPA